MVRLYPLSPSLFFFHLWRGGKGLMKWLSRDARTTRRAGTGAGTAGCGWRGRSSWWWRGWEEEEGGEEEVKSCFEEVRDRGTGIVGWIVALIA